MPANLFLIRIRRLLIIGTVCAVYYASLVGTEFSLTSLGNSLPAMGDFLANMFPPDWGYLANLMKPLIETIQVGIISTVAASLISIPVALLASRNLSPSMFVYYPTRFVLTVFRAVSELIWALVFVVAVGLGPFAGVIAIIIFAVGAQGKLLSEAIEATDKGPLEAFESSGCPKWKAFLYGAFPNVWPQYITICLYFWDHNTRAAAVLGFVGGGGLGYNLLFSLNSYQFQRATVTLILLVALIAVIDRISLALRNRIA